jgi:hypothetical protein
VYHSVSHGNGRVPLATAAADVLVPFLSAVAPFDGQSVSGAGPSNADLRRWLRRLLRQGVVSGTATPHTHPQSAEVSPPKDDDHCRAPQQELDGDYCAFGLAGSGRNSLGLACIYL